MNRKKWIAAAALATALIFAGCFGGGGDDDDGDDNPIGPGPGGSMETESRTGALSLPEGSTLSGSGLEVLSFADAVTVAGAGAFSLQANQADNYQMLFARAPGAGKPALLGLYDPIGKVTTMNDSTTALGMALMNPYLAYAGPALKSQFMNEALRGGKFAALVGLINDAHRIDGASALDYATNPGVYQKSAELMKETMEALGGGGAVAPLKEAPRFEGVGGGKLSFYNSRQIAYVAGVYDNMGVLKDVIEIGGKEEGLTYQWGWPPVVSGGEEKTDLTLADGTYDVRITKGADYTRFSAWSDPAGRATALNTGKTVLRLVELVIGKAPDVDFEDLSKSVSFTTSRAAALNSAIASGNAEEYVTGMAEWIAENKTGIADWVWGEEIAKADQGAREDFLAAAAGMLADMTLVFELLGMDNEDGPLFWDYLFSPVGVDYTVTLSGGGVTSSGTNDPPTAEFTVTPPAGVVGTYFSFDGSLSTDDQDAAEALLYRWDWESDGVWDFAWNGATGATHSYAEAGAYDITLEVQDSGGLVGSVVHTLNVGGGAGSASHVKLFIDLAPWKPDSLEAPSNSEAVTVLEELGFTEGTGDDTYEIIGSDMMATAPLVPGQDLVIVSNDQSQNFYNIYAENQIRFNNFVYTGGALFWEACDNGWNFGDIVTAGITLPGNVTIQVDMDTYNYVTDQALPLVSGLPDTLDHDNASHDAFFDLPDGTTIYCVNEEGEPTLVEYNLGGGWVILTGQPLEHQYSNVHWANDMEELLPRIIAYFTGKTYVPGKRGGGPAAGGRPSSTR